MTFCMKHLGSQNPPRLHTINYVTFFYKYLGYSTCKHPLILRLQRHSQSLFPQEVVSVLSLRHDHGGGSAAAAGNHTARPGNGPHEAPTHNLLPGTSSRLTLTVTELWNWKAERLQPPDKTGAGSERLGVGIWPIRSLSALWHRRTGTRVIQRGIAVFSLDTNYTVKFSS